MTKVTRIAALVSVFVMLLSMFGTTLPAGQALAEPADQNETTHWNRYIDPLAGFRLLHPPAWNIEQTIQNEPPVEQYVMLQELELADAANTTVSVSTWLRPESMDLETWWQTIGLPQFADPSHAPPAQSATLDGMPALISYPPPAEQARWIVAAAAHNEFVTVLAFHAPLDNLTEADFHTLLETLAWSEAPTGTSMVPPFLDSDDASGSLAEMMPDSPTLAVTTCCGVSSPGNPFPCDTARGNGNCTWWAHHKRTDIGCLGDAKTWADCARSRGFLVDNNPQAGAVAVDTYGRYGHVFYVEQVHGVTGSHIDYTISQMGWGVSCNAYGWNGVPFRVEHDRSRLQFIHRKGAPPPPPPPADPCDLIEVGQGSSRQHLFQEAYNRDGGRANIGCPYNEAHWWHGVVIQDFKKEGSNEHVAIIHDELNDDPHGSIPAFVIRGDIFKYYISQNGPGSSLGPPTTDEFIGYNGNPQSNFRGGYITKIDNAWQARPWPERKEGYWYAEYRNGHNIAKAGRACVVNESFAYNLVSADWGEHSSPYGDNCGVWADMFSMVWSRNVEFPSTGNYTFFAGGDDRAKIWLDGELLFDIAWDLQEKTHYVSAGSHEVVIEYQAHTLWDHVYFGFTLPVGDGSSRQAAFMEAYNRFGGEAKLGWPDNRAHWWGDIPETVVIQDFTRPDGQKAAIIHDEMSDDPEGTVPAFVIQGDIWAHYLELGGWESWLGVPTSDEFINADGNPQSNFRNGYIVRTGLGAEAYPWPDPQTDQWHAVYRNGSNLDAAPSLVRSEPAIDANWGTDSPGSGTWGIFADYFNIHWTRTVAFETGIYEMQASTDDGIRVSINGEEVIDEWYPQPLTLHAQQFRINEPGQYNVVVEYYELEGEALAQVAWGEADIINIPPLQLQQTNAEIVDIPPPSEPLTLPEVTVPFTPTNDLPPLTLPVTPIDNTDMLSETVTTEPLDGTKPLTSTDELPNFAPTLPISGTIEVPYDTPNGAEPSPNSSNKVYLPFVRR
jgi:hypothetical protein